MLYHDRRVRREIERVYPDGAGVFVLVSVVGGLIGKSLNAKLDQAALQHGSAVFLAFMSLFIVGREGFTIINPTSGESAGVVSPGGTPHED